MPELRVSPASRYGPLLVAVVAVSFGSILVRMAHAPALTVGFYRVALAAALVAAPALRGAVGAWPRLPGSSRLALVGSGLALALHFATWIASLSYTSVSASVLLVNTAPLFTLLLSWLFLDEPPTWDLSGALLIAFAGVLLIATGEMSRVTPALTGDLLALAGAVSLSAYHVLGRALRGALPLLAYVFCIWSVAALALALLAVASGTPLGGLEGRTLLVLLALAVVPTLAGHGLVNRSLRVLPATIVGLFMLGEPVGATILAYGLFGEVPTARVLAGGALILASLAWLLVRRRA
jgi:drug/metabolite transporter (DMT)-like permease